MIAENVAKSLNVAKLAERMAVRGSMLDLQQAPFFGPCPMITSD
jgi:hypothetical protein